MGPPALYARFPRCTGSLSGLGIHNLQGLHWNLGPAQLLEQSLQRHEGAIAANGALVVKTGQFTGRSPRDKYVVRQPETETTVHWGSVNQPMSEAAFDRLFRRLCTCLEGLDLFVQDCYGGADPGLSVAHPRGNPARLARFVRAPAFHPGSRRQEHHRPKFTIVFAPTFRANPGRGRHQLGDLHRHQLQARPRHDRRHHVRRRDEEIGLHDPQLPAARSRACFPCTARRTSVAAGDSALFFGLSGTGKTTLSADPTRALVGDDEHGWSDHGVFNFEGGCYAKCIRLSRENEPQIWNAIRFGTVLENVAMDYDRRTLDFDSEGAHGEHARRLSARPSSTTPCSRASPAIPNNIVFLTADAFGVLPPIARLTPEQAMYHFLSGYTSKLAGTERGLGKEPVPNFSACFGEPFLPRAPHVYAAMLGRRDAARMASPAGSSIPAGWAARYGIGKRMDLPYTRAMVDAAIEGRSRGSRSPNIPVFRVAVPAVLSRGSAPSCSTPAACGPTRPPTTVRPANWPSASRRTSAGSGMWPPRSPRRRPMGNR